MKKGNGYMGRKRLDESDKKIRVNLSIKKKYLDEIKAKNINLSELVENFIKDYLKR